MRIGGMASGMDTEKIISDLMKANRIPLDKVTQKKQYLQWQLNDYRSINRDLKATSDKVFNSMMLEETFRSKNVTISNPDAVSIKNTNSKSDFSGTISVEQLAKQATIQGSGTIGLDLKQKISSLNPSVDPTLEIRSMDKNGKMVTTKIDIDTEKDTIESVLGKINSKSEVTAFYDTFTGQFAFTAKNSGTNVDGEASDITITGGIAGFMGVEGVKSENGQNAKFTFNGLKTERPSNSFTINGFEVNLKQVTTSNVTFSSTPDTDKIADTVIQFVNDYNKMVEELNAKIREPKYRDFQPLSAEEKKDMKENEIKLWEEKAMSGTLRNDPAISSMLTKMRDALNSEVEGSDSKKIRLSDLGITTSNNYKDNGKLIIDEKKLRQMIAEEPNKVSELFTKTDEGLATKFKKVIDESQKSISKLAGSAGAGNGSFTLGNTMKSMDEQIVRFEDRMKKMEDRLWKNFNAMEQAINRANAQSAGLMSALGGG